MWVSHIAVVERMKHHETMRLNCPIVMLIVQPPLHICQAIGETTNSIGGAPGALLLGYCYWFTVVVRIHNQPRAKRVIHM